jgi:predicted nucleic acid-binding protein
MMRAVLDTNVVVSALIWGGTPFARFKAATDGDLLLTTSSAMLEVIDPPPLPAPVSRDPDDGAGLALAAAAQADMIAS